MSAILTKIRAFRLTASESRAWDDLRAARVLCSDTEYVRFMFYHEARLFLEEAVVADCAQAYDVPNPLFAGACNWSYLKAYIGGFVNHCRRRGDGVPVWASLVTDARTLSEVDREWLLSDVLFLLSRASKGLVYDNIALQMRWRWLDVSDEDFEHALGDMLLVGMRREVLLYDADEDVYHLPGQLERRPDGRQVVMPGCEEAAHAVNDAQAQEGTPSAQVKWHWVRRKLPGSRIVHTVRFADGKAVCGVELRGTIALDVADVRKLDAGGLLAECKCCVRMRESDSARGARVEVEPRVNIGDEVRVLVGNKRNKLGRVTASYKDTSGPLVYEVEVAGQADEYSSEELELVRSALDRIEPPSEMERSPSSPRAASPKATKRSPSSPRAASQKATKRSPSSPRAASQKVGLKRAAKMVRSLERRAR